MSASSRGRGDGEAARAGLLDPVAAVLGVVASQGLPGAPALSSLDLDPEAADALVSRAITARLTGPLLLAADAGEVALPEAAVEALAEGHRGALLWCLHLERRLLDLLERLDGIGVRPVLLKGAAEAHLGRADPSLRTFADLDLLVPGAAMDRVVALLGALGGERPWAPRRPGFDARFAKSVTVRLPDGVEVDLHRNLCDGVHGVRVPPEELFAAPAAVEVGGRVVAALRPEHRLLHAAHHAVLGSPTPSLHNLRDLAGHLVDPAIAVEAVAATAARWRGTAVLAVGVDAARAALRFDAPAWVAWRSAVEVTPAGLAEVASQREDGSSFGRTGLATLGELPSRADQLAYLAAVAWPTSAHLASRGQRRTDLLHRAAARLRALGRPTR